jgi:hypothetical protein
VFSVISIPDKDVLLLPCTTIHWLLLEVETPALMIEFEILEVVPLIYTVWKDEDAVVFAPLKSITLLVRLVFAPVSSMNLP